MEKISVKKPFTVLVAVILVIALGVVSMINTATDLLPDISLAYLMVIIPYPGASPEKVEAEVTVPMEEALGTVNNVKNVYSVSNENFALLQLEFVADTNMDSAMVKVSSTINQTAPTLPDGAGTPSIMELSMDMIASMYIAVSVDDMDIYEQSDYVESEVIPYMQRQNGVASVTPVGLVERYVQIDLSAEKIAELNDKILAKTNEALDDAKKQLDDAQHKVDSGLAELQKQQGQFGETMSSAVFDQLDGPAQEAAKQIGATAGDLADRLEDVGDSISAADTEAGNLLWAAWNTLDSIDDLLVAAEDDVTALENDINKINSPAANATLLQRLRQLVTNMQNAAAIVQRFMSGQGTNVSLSDLAFALRRMEAFPRQAKRLMDDLMNSDLADNAQDELDSAVEALNSLSEWADDGLPQLLDTLEITFAQMTQGQLDAAVGFATAAQQLTDAQTQLASAYLQYEQAREAALNSANIDALVDASTLSQLIYAQNFAMPVGYIDDEEDNSWLLRVGDEYSSSGDIAETLLTDIDGIGTIRISDIADITVLDNAGDSYANLNGHEGIMLCIYKSSTAGTNEVSTNCTEAIETLMKEDPSLHIVKLVDQGTYIDLIIDSILKSMLLGALLAMLVLALFLKDVRPTLIVAISIPLSVLFALVMIYFTGLSLNMMTLSGLALGIGMLVDNSIVVLENIIRLNNRGIPAARASVQGAKQVAGSIIASTLTTISVFFPIVFTNGTVRELMLPLSLSVSYCLVASLIVAMTVIPASTSTILSRVEPKKNKIIERIQNGYGKALRWCLLHKALPLLVSIALLGLSVARIISMGIVVMPQITADNIQVMVSTPEEDTRDESYAKAGQVMDAILGIEGINDVGLMDYGSIASSVGGAAGTAAGGSYGEYMCFLTVPENIGKDEVIRICDDITAATAHIDAEITASSGSMTDFAAFVSSGLTINIYGANMERLEGIAADVASTVEGIEGFKNVSTGTEEQSATLHLVIDKDKAMSYGLTVAQIYMQIAQKLNTDVISTSIDVNDNIMDVRVRNNTDPLTREKLLDIEFEASSFGADQMSSMMGSFSGDASAMSGFAGAAGSASGGEDEEEEEAPKTHKLSEFAYLEETESASSIRRENLTRYISVSAETEEGYNTTLLTRELQPELDKLSKGLPNGYSVVVAGESDQVNDMVRQMAGLAALGLLFIYLIMVAQFQSLLSPFIILFTVPLAFTGGMLGLMIRGQQLSMLSLMGFLILMGTVVNNGIVFVDYTNQLRIGGLGKHDALVAAGMTRMRPILMTALTTILAMSELIFGTDMGSQLSSGMAVVIAAGLLYATFMTLFIVPVMYDILYRRTPKNIDVGSDVDDAPDDAAEFLAMLAGEKDAQESGTVV